MQLNAKIPKLETHAKTKFIEEVFNRIQRLLEIYSSGYLLILTEQVDKIYLLLLQLLRDLTSNIEELNRDFSDMFPESLHDWGEGADVGWDFVDDSKLKEILIRDYAELSDLLNINDVVDKVQIWEFPQRKY
jgi:malate synthase